MMEDIDVKKIIEEGIASLKDNWDVKGIIDAQKRIYTISNDTKLISKIFELVAAPLISRVARSHNIAVVEADRQNIYPDFTLEMPDNSKVALDIKSTYRKQPNRVGGFTLGSYIGYLREPTKNIMRPYDEYSEHLILGFIYSRVDDLKVDMTTLAGLDRIAPAIRDIEIICQPKYRIAAENPGSGNTENIGSVKNIAQLREGRGPFAEHGVELFEDYWRNFVRKRDASNRGMEQPYNNIEGYLRWKAGR